MPDKNISGGAPAANAYRETAAFDKILWSDSTEEEYLKQIVGDTFFGGDESKEEQGETSTLPGAIKAMDDIFVDENASLATRDLSTLERILRLGKEKKVNGSNTNTCAARDETDIAGGDDNDDNCTIDEMIEESEREEETNLNNMFERIPATSDSVPTAPPGSMTSTKIIRMKINKSVDERNASLANCSKKKSLTSAMNNNFSSGPSRSGRDANDSLAGDETIGKIVTHMIDGGNSTVEGEEERTVRSWTDFQPIAGSVATPKDKKSYGNNDNGDAAIITDTNNKFVNDETSVGSISGDLEIIVKKSKREVDDEGTAIKDNAGEEAGTLLNTMVSTLTHDQTYSLSDRSLGKTAFNDKNAAITPPASDEEDDDKDNDVEKGEAEPWWMQAEKFPTTPIRASTPSPQSSIGKSKEAPGTPSTFVIVGMATSNTSDIDSNEGEDNQHTMKSDIDEIKSKIFASWEYSAAFFKRISAKYGSFYPYVIVCAIVMLLISVILASVAFAKLGKVADESNELYQPHHPGLDYDDNIFDANKFTIEELPSKTLPPIQWTYADKEDGFSQTNPSNSYTDQSTIEDANNLIDPDPVSDQFTIEDTNNLIDLDPVLESQEEDFSDPSVDQPQTVQTEPPNAEFVFFYERFIKTITEEMPESLPKLEDPTSPQHRALKFLESNPPTVEELKFKPFFQKYVLAVLYFATNGEEWFLESDWLSSKDECDWFSTSPNGSLCDWLGRVIEIDLRNNNLKGSIPSELVFLSDYLTRIRVNGNSLTGTIPSFLGELTNLGRLHINLNLFTGTIPMSALPSSLLSLRLGSNELVGTIPWQLRDLQKLKAMTLGNNELTGTIPQSLGDLTGLTDLDLSNNELTGTIPFELMKLGLIETLELDRNNLTGSMPTEVCSRTPFLEIAQVDCEEVKCWCCEGCND